MLFRSHRDLVLPCLAPSTGARPQRPHHEGNATTVLQELAAIDPALLEDLTGALDHDAPALAGFDNQPTWDNITGGGGFDNRPSWDNWSKK